MSDIMELFADQVRSQLVERGLPNTVENVKSVTISIADDLVHLGIIESYELKGHDDIRFHLRKRGN